MGPVKLTAEASCRAEPRPRAAFSSGPARPTASVDPLTGLEAARLAVYVHFPWCLSKCPYCDFASTVARSVPEERYTAALLAELAQRADAIGSRPVEAIFFGGGTPSLWSPAHVEAVLHGLSSRLTIAPGCEVTLEANPGASDASRFAAYRAAGINRLSIGVQSFDASTLGKLGRSHDGDAAVRAFGAARAAGFDNVSMDFIYGVWGQTVDEVRRDAVQAAALGSEHLSAYALTLDSESLAEEVPLARQLARGELTLPPDEVVVEMQRAVRDVFQQAGLERYEVSNYARAGYHSRHNSAYWTGGDWLALGVGATGSLGSLRYSNVRSPERYLVEVEAGRLPEKSREHLSDVERFEERLAMGLRLATGIDIEAVCEAFGQSSQRRKPFIDALLAEGLATREGRRLRLTEKGLDVHSAISARLL